MKVVVAARLKLDLGQSQLNEEAPTVKGAKTVVGAALFDDQERIVPLVSEYLSRGVKDASLAYQSAETYGRNLGYLIKHHQALDDYKHLTADQILMVISRSGLSHYFYHLRVEEELDSTTLRNRDACYMAFFSNFLCSTGHKRSAYREDNPYELGLITPAPKRRLVIGCDPSELKGLLLSTELERERCLLQFMHDAGTRRSEVGRVTLLAVKEALRFANTQMVSTAATVAALPAYCPVYIEGSKGAGNETKPRYSIVSRPTLERIRKYHASPLYKTYARKFRDESETPCFFNSDGEAYSADAISKLLERVSKRGVMSGRLSRAVSPHKLRHGNAYAILNSPDLGTDFLDRLVITQKSLGHARLETVETYTAIPQSIYRTLCGTDSELKTRAEITAQLVSETRKRIGLGDKK